MFKNVLIALMLLPTSLLADDLTDFVRKAQNSLSPRGILGLKDNGVPVSRDQVRDAEFRALRLLSEIETSGQYDVQTVAKLRKQIWSAIEALEIEERRMNAIQTEAPRDRAVRFSGVSQLDPEERHLMEVILKNGPILNRILESEKFTASQTRADRILTLYLRLQDIDKKVPESSERRREVVYARKAFAASLRPQSGLFFTNSLNHLYRYVGNGPEVYRPGFERWSYQFVTFDVAKSWSNSTLDQYTHNLQSEYEVLDWLASLLLEDSGPTSDTAVFLNRVTRSFNGTRKMDGSQDERRKIFWPSHMKELLLTIAQRASSADSAERAVKKVIAWWLQTPAINSDILDVTFNGYALAFSKVQIDLAVTLPQALIQEDQDLGEYSIILETMNRLLSSDFERSWNLHRLTFGIPYYSRVFGAFCSRLLRGEGW